MGKLRVLLADDHAIMREGLKFILRKRDKYEVIAEADSGSSVVELADRFQPDVIVMDIKMPIFSGIEAARQIKETCPDIKILTLSANISTLTFRQAYKAGITGFVDKQSVFQELYDAIDAVSGGSTYYCSRVRSLMGEDLKDMMNGWDDSDALTVQDRDLVQMLADGKSITEIGEFLNKSPKTIDARRRKIMNQLGLSNLAQLTKYAISENITTPDING